MTARPPPLLRLRVPLDLAGTRLDRVLALLLEGTSRTRVQAAIQAGGVRLDGVAVDKPGLAVEAHAELEVDPRALAPRQRVRARGRPFGVLHEDEHLAVIDKPAGMLAHPTPSVRGGTVSELAVERWGPLPTLQGEDRPGLVHRLDAGTSGVMVLGRSERAFADLMRQFRAREVEKVYLAVVWGEPRFDTDWVDAPIARSAAAPGRMDVAEAGAGRQAETYFEVRERFGRAALVACFPRSGRTHQIRVHMHHVGHPLVGDPLYKPRGGSAGGLEGAPVPGRQALHASALTFRHPIGGERRTFEAPLPDDLRALLDWLRAARADG